MEYAILIYSEESALPETWDDPEKAGAFMQGYGTLNAELNEAGAFRSARRLANVETATTLREVDGAVSVTDGPFAETKETLAGFYLIEAPDLDAALAWARKVPGIRIGSVEVRPVHAQHR